MKSKGLLLAAVVATTLCGMLAARFADQGSIDERRTAAKKQLDAGNFKDSYEMYEDLIFARDADPAQVGSDLSQAVQCLRRLGQTKEFDALVEKAVDAHATNWRFLFTAAELYSQIEHYGFRIAGEFQRGQHRGGGNVQNSAARDRVRMLQLMVQAQEHMPQDVSGTVKGQFYLTFAEMLSYRRGGNESWRMQYLTDLSTLPDYEDGWYYGRNGVGAAVDEEGNPVYYTSPQQFDEAENDGQRWRWALTQAAESSPRTADRAQWEFASFLQQQFGVQTMQSHWHVFRSDSKQADDDESEETGTYALHTLGENETIARLASGVKRFELPDEFNFIRLFQQLADRRKGTFANTALERLGQVFENRRQYDKAADYWRRSIKQHGDSKQKQQRLDQIVGNWGTFEPTGVHPAGQGVPLDFRYRNGEKLKLVAHEIKIEKLLDDVKRYLKSNPTRLDGNKLNISNIGYRLIQQNEGEYLGDEAANWELKLDPRPGHFDRRITITTPMQKPGAYLLKARMADGNTSNIVVWVSDTVILHKPMGQHRYYFIADAVSGRPIEKANVEFFGYQQKRVEKNQYQVSTKDFAEFTDADGQVIPDAKRMPENFQWLVMARTPQGRLAYLGFNGVWFGARSEPRYDQTKVFTITDRPVYRPNDAVQFKLWVRRATYDLGDVSTFAGETFRVEIHNAKGDKVLEKDFKADAYGGIQGTLELPSDAQLGVYQVMIPGKGGGQFRVEEYKKPEFEVTVDAPDDPVRLGETVKATISARYYFGSPVTEAKVKYKVLRTSQTEHWYPKRPWDWLYGSGYGWFSPDYKWYRGWGEWGCIAPTPIWWPQHHGPPEVVSENEVEIGPDGTVEIEIDTSLALAAHPDQDHRYEITAEVVDPSRRTIVGSGKLLVARKPFKVFVWVDRGYYRVGDTVQASIQAHTLDQKPVTGKGEARLLKISYDEKHNPVETLVQQWDLDTDTQGQASLKMTASQAGQYRLVYDLTDAHDQKIEGAYLFTVIGTGFDSAGYRFNALEIIADQREYHPGDKVKLLINTDRANSTVALFVKPSNGVYSPPKIVRLEGKSTTVEIDVAAGDMPNFFVEALSIADGRMNVEVKQIAVPPEKRIIDVKLEPSSEEYLPGEKATVKVTLTQENGEPLVGSTVLSIYDKSVEYISGGSNVSGIRDFFWKWLRSHYPQNNSNLQRYFNNIIKPGEQPMNSLGVFGHTVADEIGDLEEGEDRADGNRWGMQTRENMAQLGQPMERSRMMKADGVAAAPMLADAAAPGAAGGVEAESSGTSGEQPQMVDPTVRKNFADTALWVGSIETDGDGTATVSLDMPESLTTWKIRAWSMGQGTRVGQAEAEVVTRKNLLVRLQAPRFFVETDEVVLSANVHNYLATAKDVRVQLETEGGVLEPLGETSRTVTIDAEGHARVDWRVRVIEEGEATVRMKALSDEESDAMQMSFPAYVHGMLKTESFTGTIRPDDSEATVEMTVPSQRRLKDSRLEIRYSPTLAGAMVDALPYMVNYPYGCTEQTLNRFLPTVITQKILLEMNLDLKAIQEKRTNLNAQEIGDDQKRAEGWKHYDRNPVFDQDEVVRMVKEGVDALQDMQLSDGGWGWFSGYGERSYPHTTAYVVHGLQLAQQNDVALVPGMLDTGVAWLTRYQDQQVQKLKNAPDKTKPYKLHADNLDAFVYMVLIDAGVENGSMDEYLYRDRTKLSVYAKAMYGLTLAKRGQKRQLEMILSNIEQYLVQDDENQTAYLDLPNGGYWWSWYGSENEAQAYYLKLLTRVDPRGKTASRLVKYLLNNRKHATYWNSTRDTAICVEAMAEYLKASGESKPDQVVEIWIDGKMRKEVKITSENLFQFDNKLVLKGEAVTTGVHQVEMRKKGKGPLYFNAYLTYFTLEDPITAAGLEVKVHRKYYKLHEVDQKEAVAGSRGQVIQQKVEKYRREELTNLATLTSGDLVEIELEIDSKNDYEYLLFEDMKAAGFEPVEVRSGYNGNDLGAYVEFRDNRVAFFVRSLMRGKHSVSYRMRAEIPGQFSALPTRASAMYAPELKANSNELKVTIQD
jgi:hypothetical protein